MDDEQGGAGAAGGGGDDAAAVAASKDGDAAAAGNLLANAIPARERILAHTLALWRETPWRWFAS